MKINDLFEGPYQIGGQLPHVEVRDSYTSLENLKREFDHLGVLTKRDRNFNFWLTKPPYRSNTNARVTTDSVNELNKSVQLDVTTLWFDNRAGLPVKNELQVGKVYTHPEFRGMWLAGALYIVLARYGFTIVSDFDQYRGGKELWKKLAAESEARNYVVRVWDDTTTDWVRDQNNEPLKYNADNLADEQVWTQFKHLPTALLALSSE